MLTTYKNFGGVFTPFGARNESMWSNFFNSIGADLKDDHSIQIWTEGLMRDPLVKLTRGIMNEAAFLGKTTLFAGTAIAKTICKPITYPLSKIIKKPKYVLTECPFEVAKVYDTQDSALVLRKLNLLESSMLSLKNIHNMLTISSSPAIRTTYNTLHTLVSIPIKYFTEPSKEQLVLMSIQAYFPSFNIADFIKWAKSSFLPVFIQRFLRGNITDLQEMASQKIVKERRLAILDLIEQRLIIRSRLLDITDVDVVGYDFGDQKPSILLRCSCDHTYEIRTLKNQLFAGGPQSIQHTDFLIAISVDSSGEKPKWMVTEVSAGDSKNRI